MGLFSNIGNWISGVGNSINDTWNYAINEGLPSIANWAGNLVGTFTEPITHNMENLQMQKDELNYQHNLQDKVFQREDTAQQRAAADLASAGLSKTLAAGSGAGSGAVVSTHAPQRGTDLDMLSKLALVSTQMAGLSHTKAETERLKLQNDLTKLDLDYFKNNGLAPAGQNQYTALAEAITTILGKEGLGKSAGNVIFNAIQGASSPFAAGIRVLGNAMGGAASSLPAGAAAPVVEALDTVADYVGAKRNVDSEGPNPALFNNYDSYVHACKLNGFNPVDFTTWSNVRFYSK